VTPSSAECRSAECRGATNSLGQKETLKHKEIRIYNTAESHRKEGERERERGRERERERERETETEREREKKKMYRMSI
jgi:hypothetical protein